MTNEEIWLALPMETRLAVACHIFDMATKPPGCSFRRLIYDRLKFETNSYRELYCAGGMLITNALSDYELLIDQMDKENGN